MGHVHVHVHPSVGYNLLYIHSLHNEPISDTGYWEILHSTLHYTLTIQPTTTESRDIRKAPALGFLPDMHMHLSSTLLGSFPRAHNLSTGGVGMVCHSYIC